MRRITVCALLAVLLSGGAPANAAQPEFAGVLCNWERKYNDGDWVGAYYGGPLAAYDPAPAGNPVALTLTCTVRTGDWEVDHTDPVVSTASGSGPGVAAAPLTPVTAPALNATLAVCTSATADGVTYYWDAWNQVFGTDPGVTCGPIYCPLSSDDPCGEDPFEYVVDETNRLFVEVVDPLVCPVFATVAPPEGDLPVWDCPPYS